MKTAAPAARQRPEPPEHTFEFFGTQARLLGNGTYAEPYSGHNGTGFLEWHDGERRRVAKTTATVLFEGAKVNGVSYQGRVDLLLPPAGYRTIPEGETKPVWVHEYPSWIRRAPHGGDPTDKARTAIIDGAVAYVREFAKTGPGMVFFGYKAERYALADEWHRLCCEDDRLTRELIACRRTKGAFADRIKRLDATHGGVPERVRFQPTHRDREDMREQANSEGGI